MPTSRRQWFRYSLTTMLVLVPVAGLSLGWLITPENPTLRPKKLLITLEGYRTKLPPAQGMGERNGKSVAGMTTTFRHLSGVARRLGVKTKAECLVLLTYVNDPNLDLRIIAIQAIEGLVHAYPGGMSASDLTDLGSEGHGRMVLTYAKLIENLDK